MVDNYDSFTYNLVQYLGELGASSRSCATTARPSTTCSGGGSTASSSRPGRARPNEAGISARGRAPLPRGRRPDARRLPRPPVAGAGVRRRRRPPRAGARQDHDRRARRQDDLHRHRIPARRGPLPLARRREDTLPDCFEASAHGGGVLMAIRHRELPAEGVQFHPESVLTDAGQAAARNFLGA